MTVHDKGSKGPTRLDLRRMADAGVEVDGALPGSALARLAQDVVRLPTQVAWSARADWQAVAGAAPQLRLRLQCTAPVALICQRCLQAMDLTLEVDRRFRFVRDEAEAERLDEDSEDDMLVLPPRGTLDLAALVEDELILMLPLVPRHERCPHPLAAGQDVAAESTPKPRPFEILAALKGKMVEGPPDEDPPDVS